MSNSTSGRCEQLICMDNSVSNLVLHLCIVGTELASSLLLISIILRVSPFCVSFFILLLSNIFSHPLQLTSVEEDVRNF